MGNVQNCDGYIDIPLSQTYRTVVISQNDEDKKVSEQIRSCMLPSSNFSYITGEAIGGAATVSHQADLHSTAVCPDHRRLDCQYIGIVHQLLSFGKQQHSDRIKWK
jgi:hypothetical protein